MNKTAFAHRLRSAMQTENITSAELARRTGIDKTNISHLVTGDRAPSMGTLSRLLVSLPNVSARWLVTGET